MVGQGVERWFLTRFVGICTLPLDLDPLLFSFPPSDRDFGFFDMEVRACGGEDFPGVEDLVGIGLTQRGFGRFVVTAVEMWLRTL